MRRLCLGNGLLFFCSLFYLAWWILAFKPGCKVDGFSTKALLLAASICGIAALVLTIMGIRSLPVERIFTTAGTIAWGGIIAYVVLFALTFLLLRRQVTSELFLIIGWTVLELCMLKGLYGAKFLEAGGAIVLGVVLIIAAIISLICYILYYNLEGMASYIDGMVPLILVALVMIILEISCIDI